MLALIVVDMAAVVKRFSMIRVEANGLIEGFDGAVVVAVSRVSDPAVVEELCVIRVYLDRLLQAT